MDTNLSLAKTQRAQRKVERFFKSLQKRIENSLYKTGADFASLRELFLFPIKSIILKDQRIVHPNCQFWVTETFVAKKMSTLNQYIQHSLVKMEFVLRLIPDNRARSLHNFFAYFLSAVRRQAVHDNHLF